MFQWSMCLLYIFVINFPARAEEEATSTPTKLTNQLFVKSANTANNMSNTNTLLNGDDSLGAATFVSVVSHSRAQKCFSLPISHTKQNALYTHCNIDCCPVLLLFQIMFVNFELISCAIFFH